MISSIWLKLSFARKSSGDARRQFFRVASVSVADDVKRGGHAVHGKTNGVREFGVKQEEFRDTQRTNLRGLRFAVCFESGAAPQKSDPLRYSALSAGRSQTRRRA